ncbi:ABC transporter substrate-binding protein [Lederbergia sp. NSJ-179]|uniref:ABC transporter substrate-binding protein n=1 Tax=Lederbergia sp. NSJ-179 TaxID=2931402 RepID=UPI001FCFFC62|nr:ABC transporter substrate-binding protein [Lederbergia sp. NSJ-179]MCJ7842498.1 ABC transporter substrate-binding protein [Lederbergia sp. NSJ-179]
MTLKQMIIAIGFILLLSGCAGEKSTGENKDGSLQTVRFAGFAGINGLPVHYGIEKGFFEDEGLSIEFVDTEDQIAALASNEVDIAEASTTNAIIGAGREVPLKIISSMYRTKGPFYLISQPDIETVEDLKGKTVGIARNGIGMELYTREILKQHGIGEDDVTLLANGRHQDAYSSLLNKQVDATIIHEPFASLGELSGKARLLANGWDYLPSFHTGVVTAHTDFIDSEPEVITKFLRAYFKSNEYAKENLDEYLEYVGKNVDIEADVLQMVFEREEPIWENEPQLDLDAIQSTQEIQLEYGFQDEIYDVEQFIDSRFISDLDEEKEE